MVDRISRNSPNKTEPASCCPMKELDSGQFSTGEMVIEALDGTFLISCTPMMAKDGRIEKIIHIATEITEQIEAKKSLQESEQKYIQLSEQLEGIVAERTEDLQTTLNLMAGREVRMAELKKVIKKLRDQLQNAGLEPVANDPLLE